MQSYVEPIERVSDRARYWLRSRKARVLHLVASENLVPAVQDLLSALEHFALGTPRVCIVVDAPTGRDDDGWNRRVLDLSADYADRGKRAAELQIAWPDEPAMPAESQSGPLRFALHLEALSAFYQSRGSQTVVVLCPAWNEDHAGWNESLRALLSSPTLQAVRWAVVDRETAISLPAVSTVAGVVQCDATVTDDAMQRDLASMATQVAAASPGAPGPAQVGAAWPAGVVPPARPETQTPDAATATSIASAHRVRQLLFGAAAAMGARGYVEAIRLQREARDLAAARGEHREAAVMELALGSYVQAAGELSQAMTVFNDAVKRATDANALDLAAQALLGVAALEHLQGQIDASIATQARAANVALQASLPTLAIECWRLCGEALQQQGRQDEARSAWSRALAIASQLSPTELAASSAALVASAMAAQFRTQGHNEQADTMEARAQQWRSAASSVAVEAGVH